MPPIRRVQPDGRAADWNAPHAKVGTDLAIVLGAPFRLGIGGPGGWVFLAEPRLALGREIRVPDLAGWRAERFGELPLSGPITLVPEWICDILSPSTEADDRGPKRDLYARHGVAHLWLMSPLVKTLEVYRLTPEGWLLASSIVGERRVRVEPFEAVEIDLALVWPAGDLQGPDDS